MVSDLKFAVFTHIYLFIILFMDAVQSASNPNTKGRAFMLTYFKNDGSDSQNGIIISTELKTVIFVNVPSTASLTRHLLQANSSVHVQLPYETTVTSWGIPERKAVSLYSMEPVSVYGISSTKSSSGGYMAIPVDKWSDHYIVATYDGYLNNGGEIIIISADDNTSISVWLNVVKFTRCVAKDRTVDRSTLLSFRMNKEDVLRIACDDDLTGSVIKGSNPIGVISGNMCIQIPKAFAFCDQVIEMMIPTTSLGRDYIIAPLAGRESQFRVIYTDSEGQTNMTVNQVGPGLTVSRANRLYKEFIISPGAVVRLNTSKPVLVVLYSTGSNATDSMGDPSMTIVVPLERYDSEYNINFDWGHIIDTSYLNFDLNVLSSGNVLRHVKGEFDLLSSVKAFGFVVLHANFSNRSFVSKNSFLQGSNMIVSTSSKGSTAAFPVGMKLNYFTGVDNCTDSPCHHGICYTHGHRLFCYCGDQLGGDRCQDDIVDSCASSPCQNNSTCTDMPFLFKCTCSGNFTGEFCESALKDSKEENSKVVRKTEMCTCLCENVTFEMIETKKEQIKKELTVNVKETNKNKNRYSTTYDPRPSATSIGIVGILFLILVLGCIVLLDLITAVSHIMGYFTRRKNAQTLKNDVKEFNTTSTISTCGSNFNWMHGQSESAAAFGGHEFPTKITNSWADGLAPTAAPMACINAPILQANVKTNAAKLLTAMSNARSSTFTNTDHLPMTSYSCTRTHSAFYMPRFRITSKNILAVGEDGEAFKMQKCSWGLKKVLQSHDTLDVNDPEASDFENKSDSK